MSTWQLFSDSSVDGFRWEVAGRILQSDPDSTPIKTLESAAPLPSMADLLLQGDSSCLLFFFKKNFGGQIRLREINNCLMKDARSL